MSGMLGVVSYGLGTVFGFNVICVLIFWFIQDITKTKHAVLRNYPVVGRLRHFFEKQGEYFRRYFFTNGREELPFNRSVRGAQFQAQGGVGARIFRAGQAVSNRQSIARKIAGLAQASSLRFIAPRPCSIIAPMELASSFGSRSAIQTTRLAPSPSAKICMDAL